MLRIIISFLILASVFSSPARAQDKNAAAATEQPSIMNPGWKLVPSAPAEQESVRGPDSPAEMTRSPATMTHMGTKGPKKPGFSTHFLRSDGEEPPPDVKEESLNLPGLVKGDFKELRQIDTTTVERVIDALRVQLKDGRIVQLSGIDIPDMDPYDPGEISAAAKKFLESLIGGKQVRLYQTKDAKEGRTNRMGHLLAHISLGGADNAWVQGSLLAAGLARVRPSARNPEMAAQMTAAEMLARRENKGIWADPNYSVLTPDTALSTLNNWAVVEGRVMHAANVNNVLYLNFGQDWRKDFTIGLSTDIRRQLLKNSIDPMKLVGTTVRVRGWIQDYNGPYIDLLNAVWLEVLEDGDDKPSATETSKGVSQ